jgi:hypothetical protein
MGKTPQLDDDLGILRTLSPDQLRALFCALVSFYVYRTENRNVALELGKDVVKTGSRVLMGFILPSVLEGEFSLDELRDLLMSTFGFSWDQAIAIIEPIKPEMPRLRDVAIFHLLDELVTKHKEFRHSGENYDDGSALVCCIIFWVSLHELSKE